MLVLTIGKLKCYIWVVLVILAINCQSYVFSTLMIVQNQPFSWSFGNISCKTLALLGLVIMKKLDFISVLGKITRMCCMVVHCPDSRCFLKCWHSFCTNMEVWITISLQLVLDIL